MPVTYINIASTTLSSTASFVEFTSIPSTYTDLVIISSARSTNHREANLIRFNGDTGSNYSFTRIAAIGNSASSDRSSSTATQVGDTPSQTNVFSNREIYIPNYTVAAQKPFYSFNGLASSTLTQVVESFAGLWRNTATISSIRIFVNSGNYEVGTSFYLYGIKNS